jgi:hypothetical protein
MRRVDGLCHHRGQRQTEIVLPVWTICATSVDDLCQQPGSDDVHAGSTTRRFYAGEESDEESNE